MNWEDTIKNIREQPEFSGLVRDAYFDEDLSLNLSRYESSEEFESSLELLKKYSINLIDKKIIDVGAGNGISSIAFAKNGLYVYALEPDPSETVGYGAIKELASLEEVKNIKILPNFCESIPLKENSLDIAFARQAMHHAGDLKQFLEELYRVLKPGGVLVTVRDHVIEKESDKEIFFETHPLHKFYGGENAYTVKEYTDTMEAVGFKVVEELKPFDSPINYGPLTTDDIRKKMSFLGKSDFFLKIGLKYLARKYKNTPGELYSFVCLK